MILLQPVGEEGRGRRGEERRKRGYWRGEDVDEMKGEVKEEVENRGKGRGCDGGRKS